MIMKRILTLLVVMVFLLAAVNCASWNKNTRGAVIGGAGGAVLGGVIGHAAGSTILGAIIGAAVGGAAGAIIGNYMDKQAAEMQRDLEGAEIQRIGEGIKITFDSGILFDIDKSDLRPVSETNLTKLAKILNKYPDTNILIEGHTDNTGTDDYNMALSKDRAQSVSSIPGDSRGEVGEVLDSRLRRNAADRDERFTRGPAEKPPGGHRRHRQR